MQESGEYRSGSGSGGSGSQSRCPRTGILGNPFCGGWDEGGVGFGRHRVFSGLQVMQGSGKWSENLRLVVVFVIPRSECFKEAIT